MKIGLFLNDLPTWLLFLLILGVCVLTSKAGNLVGRRLVKAGIEAPIAPIGTAVAAVLGLLAFMLGFTFSITEDRYTNRKELVIAQANAIGTCYLRTSYLPQKQKQAIRKYLREYTDLLLQSKTTTLNDKTIVRLDELQLLMWNQTATLDLENMDSEIRSLFIRSLNEVIDLATERKTVALIFRIPDIIWTSLLLLFIFSMFTIGYQTGILNLSRNLSVPLLAIAFTIVIALIADMDSTGKGHIKVSQQPLKETREMMEKNIR